MGWAILMIDVLRIAHLRIAPQEGNSEVGNCEVHRLSNVSAVSVKINVTRLIQHNLLRNQKTHGKLCKYYRKYLRIYLHSARNTLIIYANIYGICILNLHAFLCRPNGNNILVSSKHRTKMSTISNDLRTELLLTPLVPVDFDSCG